MADLSQLLGLASLLADVEWFRAKAITQRCSNTMLVRFKYYTWATMSLPLKTVQDFIDGRPFTFNSEAVLTRETTNSVLTVLTVKMESFWSFPT